MLNDTRLVYLIPLSIFLIVSCSRKTEFRNEISLNGEWEIAKTEVSASKPGAFSSSVPVPGLVDMAVPVIDDQDTSYEDAVYWYKREFITPDADLVRLKITKAKYTTKVYINERFVGENVYNFTPSYFDIKPYLNQDGLENELVIAVGSGNNAPDTVMTGHDFEKIKYIPGIYDDVKIISSGFPFISNVQTVPDVQNESVKTVVEIDKERNDNSIELSYQIRELVSQEVVASGTEHFGPKSNDNREKVEFSAVIPEAKLWSPESPFLYELHIKTQGDELTMRFGMRSFSPNTD